jgi:hypothetical protein
MGHQRTRLALAAGLLCGVSLAVGSTVQPARAAADSSPGAKGAQIYCFMRSNGNNHQVSWDAAYALIKRQSASLFKTSPEHAAVMITEAVVQNPGTYPDCGRFLGDLFVKPVTPETPAPQGGGAQTRSEKLGQ